MDPSAPLAGGTPPTTQAETADAFIANEIARQRRSEATRHMLFGGLWVLGGIGLTAWTYSAQPGGQVAIFYGAIIVGAIKFFRGAMMA